MPLIRFPLVNPRIRALIEQSLELCDRMALGRSEDADRLAKTREAIRRSKALLARLDRSGV